MLYKLAYIIIRAHGKKSMHACTYLVEKTWKSPSKKEFTTPQEVTQKTSNFTSAQHFWDKFQKPHLASQFHNNLTPHVICALNVIRFVSISIEKIIFMYLSSFFSFA